MFIQIIQGRCSRPDELRKVLDRWETELAPGATDGSRTGHSSLAWVTSLGRRFRPVDPVPAS